MTFGSNVAPRRRIKPTHPQWECKCEPFTDMKIDEAGHFVATGPHPSVTPNWHPGYLARCDKCETERP